MTWAVMTLMIAGAFARLDPNPTLCFSLSARQAQRRWLLGRLASVAFGLREGPARSSAIASQLVDLAFGPDRPKASARPAIFAMRR